jgi:RNA polymerase sigma factor (sigma-70 family)
MANDDMALVHAYAADQNEKAFETLVTRYVNLVFSTALRQVRDRHLAEEVTQAVFIVLARKADRLGPNTILPSWLHRTAGFVTADALKQQRRREEREQKAYMESTLHEMEDETWRQIAPLLDAAIAGLNEQDRHAVVLRFFENKSLDEIGDALGASEDAAKMRVSRALDKLREFFLKRGVGSSTAMIAGAISANSVHAAPVTLAGSVATVAITKGATASGSTLALIKGAMKVVAWTNIKTSVAVGAMIVLAAGTTTALIVQHRQQNDLPADLPKSSWAYAGYGSPAATFETSMWAINKLNGNALLDSLSAACQEDFRKYLAHNKPGMSVDEFLLQGGNLRFAGISDIRLNKEEVLSTNVVLVQYSARGGARNGSTWLRFEKFGDDWKIDDFDPKGPYGRTGLDDGYAQYGCIGMALAFEPATHALRISKVLPVLAQSQPNLLPGLIVQKINGTDPAGRSLSECLFLTRGRVGTAVVLQLYDREHDQTNVVELDRKPVTRADIAMLGLR